MVLKKVLLTGGTGKLGTFIKNNINKNYEIISPTSSEMNLLDREKINFIFNKNKPDIVLHCAAFTDVKNAEVNYLKAINVNVVGTLNVLEPSVKNKIDFIYISTDAVFDGKDGNYKPSDCLNPQNKYSKTKAAAELMVRTYEKSVTIRTSFFEHHFPYDIAFYDQYTSKDYLDIIGPKILNTIYNYQYGIYHIGSKRRSVLQIAQERKKDVIAESKNNFKFKITSDSSFDENEVYCPL